MAVNASVARDRKRYLPPKLRNTIRILGITWKTMRILHRHAKENNLSISQFIICTIWRNFHAYKTRSEQELNGVNGRLRMEIARRQLLLDYQMHPVKLLRYSRNRRRAFPICYHRSRIHR